MRVTCPDQLTTLWGKDGGKNQQQRVLHPIEVRTGSDAGPIKANQLHSRSGAPSALPIRIPFLGRAVFLR